MKKILLFLFLALFISNKIAAQAGTLDSTFGVGGKVIMNFGASASASAVAIQSDGKIVVGGQISNQFLVERFNSDGSLDTSFSNDGWDTIGTSVNCGDLAIQSDGKIVAVGIIIVRYNLNGTLDSTFGINGTANTYSNRVGLQSNGKIIVAHGVFGTARINTNGFLDPTFGVGGTTQPISFQTEYESTTAYDIVVLPNDKIVVVGGTCTCPSSCFCDDAIAIYNSDGTLFSKFTISNEFWGYEELTSAALNSDGTLLASGIDEFFGANYVISNYGGGYPATNIYYSTIFSQPDGKFLLAGNPYQNFNDFNIARFNNDFSLSLDSSFGSNGTVITDFGSNNEQPHSIAIQPDGKIVVAGQSGGNLVLARYNNCGGTYSTVSPCTAACNGSISFISAFGNFPFNYLWSTGDTISTIDSLCSGTYSVTITDSSGCVSNYTIQLDAIAALAYRTPALCNGSCDGSASATLLNSVPPFTYLWSNGDTTDTITNLCSGTYTVSVTDSNLCTDSATVTVTQPTPITSTFNGIDASCFSLCDGSFADNIYGGNSPYVISICGGGNLVQDSLCAGIYCVIVTDAHGCDATNSFTVNEPPSILFSSSTIHNPSCTACYNGFITFNPPTGGIPPYQIGWTYHWGHMTGDTIINLPAGIYIVTATDANGCTYSFNDTLVDQPDWVRNNYSENQFIISPNPTQNQFTVYSSQFIDGTIEIYNVVGEKLISQQFAVGSQKEVTVYVSKLPASIYFVKIKTEKGSVIQKLVVQ